MRLIWPVRRQFVLFTSLAALLATALAFLLPPTYVAVTTMIPTNLPDRFSPIGRLTANLEDLGLQTGARSSTLAMYPEIVRSRRLLDQVLDLRVPRGGRQVALLDLLNTKGSAPVRRERALGR